MISKEFSVANAAALDIETSWFNETAKSVVFQVYDHNNALMSYNDGTNTYDTFCISLYVKIAVPHEDCDDSVCLTVITEC